MCLNAQRTWLWGSGEKVQVINFQSDNMLLNISNELPKCWLYKHLGNILFIHSFIYYHKSSISCCTAVILFFLLFLSLEKMTVPKSVLPSQIIFGYTEDYKADAIIHWSCTCMHILYTLKQTNVDTSLKIWST